MKERVAGVGTQQQHVRHLQAAPKLFPNQHIVLKMIQTMRGVFGVCVCKVFLEGCILILHNFLVFLLWVPLGSSRQVHQLLVHILSPVVVLAHKWLGRSLHSSIDFEFRLSIMENGEQTARCLGTLPTLETKIVSCFIHLFLTRDIVDIVHSEV